MTRRGQMTPEPIEHGMKMETESRPGYLLAALFAAALACAPLSAASAQEPERISGAGDEPHAFMFGPDDVIDPPHLPQIGKWMISPDGEQASWLGATYRNHHIREPINVVLVDTGAVSARDATDRLYAAAEAAGYPSRRGHSGGYRGFIGGEIYAQHPAEDDHAFSNRLYVFDNNHGRIFGPAPYGGAYVFIAAFSRERVAPFDTLKHQYKSFDQARDDFTQRLDADSQYGIVGFVDMGNAIVGDPDTTTGDHDGRAVLMQME